METEVSMVRQPQICRTLVSPPGSLLPCTSASLGRLNPALALSHHDRSELCPRAQDLGKKNDLSSETI